MIQFCFNLLYLENMHLSDLMCACYCSVLPHIVDRLGDNKDPVSTLSSLLIKILLRALAINDVSCQWVKVRYHSQVRQAARGLILKLMAVAQSPQVTVVVIILAEIKMLDWYASNAD